MVGKAYDTKVAKKQERYPLPGNDAWAFCHRGGDDIAAGPGGLEIEAASDGIDVQDFSGKKETGETFGFQCVWIDFRKADTAAGHEFLLESSPTGDGIGIGSQDLGQTVQAFAAQFGEADIRPQACAFQQDGPKTAGQFLGMNGSD